MFEGIFDPSFGFETSLRDLALGPVASGIVAVGHLVVCKPHVRQMANGQTATLTFTPPVSIGKLWKLLVTSKLLDQGESWRQ